MIYLKSFELLSEKIEHEILVRKLNIDNSVYPFAIFPGKKFVNIEFDTITCFYGGNGSGKTTLLNIISDAIKSNRRSIKNNGDLFRDYVSLCGFEMDNEIDLVEKKYISSDDIFDYLLDLRAVNNGVYRIKDDLKKEYNQAKYQENNFNVLEEYDEFKNSVDAKQ